MRPNSRVDRKKQNRLVTRPRAPGSPVAEAVLVQPLLSLALVATLMAGGCKSKPKKPAPASSKAPVAAASPGASKSAAAVASSPQLDEPDAASDAGDGGSALLALNDVGPAGPIAASARGVVLITKDDRIALAPLAKKKGEVKAVKEPKDQFAIARGPSVAGPYAYWISSGRLVRRKLKGGTLETLAANARSGTRVTALPKSDNRPAAVAYIGAPVTKDARGAAYLWVEGSEPLVMSPEGSAATSVSMAATADSLYVLALEGRTGMTPVHARVVGFEDSKPKLDKDVVVWVAGPAQSLTEITAAPADDEVIGLVPLERDITRFGLAEVRVGSPPKMGAPVTWRAYPNGLDPAPVAISTGCGGTMVVYARPAAPRPRSPQELHIAKLAASGLGSSSVVARASAFANVSAAETAQGVLIAYVADFRTWARLYSCEPAKR